MALSFVGTTGFQSGTGALQFPVPSGTQSGDWLLVFVNSAAQFYSGGYVPQIDSTNLTTMSGAGITTGTAGAAGGVDLTVWRTFYTSGTNINIPDCGSYQAAVCVALRGVDTTTPFTSPAQSRVDASATTTVTFPVTSAPSSTQWLVHAIGLDRDASANPYTVISGESYTGEERNLLTGTTVVEYGAITNAGAGGGLWTTAWNSGYSWSGGSFSDSTTHAYVSFYVNQAATSQNATFSATTTGSATAAGNAGALKSDATFGATTTGTATAAGNEGALTGDAATLFATSTGSATAEGVMGAWAVTSTVTSDAQYPSSATNGSWIDLSNAFGAPNNTYCTWTSSVAGAISDYAQFTGFGDWIFIPAGATLNYVQIGIEHHESHTGTPLEYVQIQGVNNTTPIDTPTSLTLALSDRQDTVNITSPTRSELQTGLLRIRVTGKRL